jgi:hypothetical protein
MTMDTFSKIEISLKNGSFSSPLLLIISLSITRFA